MLVQVLVRKFLDVRTTVTSGEVAKEAKKIDEKKQKRKKKDTDTDTSSEENTSETEEEAKTHVIGRNRTGTK